MNKKISLIVIFAAMLAISVSACSSLDVVGKGSVTSFKEILETIPDKLTADEMNAGWALSAPDDSARFIWSEDYSRSALHDVMLEMDAQPFLDAGLDPEKLPENYAYYEAAGIEYILYLTDFSSIKIFQNQTIPPLNTPEMP